MEFSTRRKHFGIKIITKRVAALRSAIIRLAPRIPIFTHHASLARSFMCLLWFPRCLSSMFATLLIQITCLQSISRSLSLGKLYLLALLRRNWDNTPRRSEILCRCPMCLYILSILPRKRVFPAFHRFIPQYIYNKARRGRDAEFRSK